MKSKFKNLIYFQNGSMGDFLMTIFFLENIHLNDNSIKLNVIIPKNKKLLSQFLEKYSYINIILANRKSVNGVLGIFRLLKFAFSKNLVITAPTPGKLSLSLKIIAKKISFFHGSQLIGFEDGQKINKFIYTKLLKYNTKIIYPDFLKNVIKELGFEVKKEFPELKYKKDGGILEELSLQRDSYIVVHTQGSSLGRSLDREKIISLIKIVQNIDPNKRIILTGGREDQKTLEEFSGLSDNILICSNLKVVDLCNLIKGSALFVGVDTGTTHIASFLNKKSLVISHPATTPNWLPYYNKNAVILYSINGCTHNIYEGREHLESCRGGILRCLGDVPLNIIKTKLREILIL